MTTPDMSLIPIFDGEPRHFIPVLPEEAEPRPSKWALPEWFAIAQVAGPALLYLPGSQAFRAPLRVGVFALSLLGLVWCWRGSRAVKAHPSAALLMIGALYMAIMIFHPATNTNMAALAQIGMHLAVAAPLFWAPRYFRGDFGRLSRVLTILWVLNGASAVVGILQARNPGTWMPAEFSTAVNSQKFKLTMYQYRAADGSNAIRPPGLGDSPGAASGAGSFIAILGIAYLGLPVSTWRKMFGFLMGAMGLVVIFLSHIRSSIVVVVGCAFVYSVILVAQGRARSVFNIAVWMAICGVCGFFYAELYGGKSTVDRFGTLFADDPLKVYEKSARLGMVVAAFDTIMVEHPLGAGLGRWGMMRKYFGNENNTDSPEIWAEVQFVAWVLDGGIVLLSTYLIALAIAIRRLIRLSLSHRSWPLRQWGAAIVMLSSGPIAYLFSYCPFYSQMGMQFWLLIGAYEGLAQGEDELDLAVTRGESFVVPNPGSPGKNVLLFTHV